MVKVSVIVPVYNVEKFIDKCLESLVRQSLNEIEIIVVNDGSTDRSSEICKQYAEKYEKIKYISQENQGLSEARNTGIELAKGEYIGFVDSDDYVDRDMFEFLYYNAINNHAMVSACGYKIVHGDRTKYSLKKGIRRTFDLDEALDCYLLNGYYNAFAWNKIYKRELFDGIRFTGRIYEDIPIIYKLIHRAGGLYYDSAAKYYYLERRDSLSRRRAESEARIFLRNIDSCVKDCLKIIERPRLIFVGQLWCYIIAYNKFLISEGENEKLVRQIRKMAVKHFRSIIFTNEVCFTVKVKILLLAMTPNIYKWIYLRIRG